uniref:receptor-interacting serine/threonine-protein kinase 1-like n=1 Tax=Myxine glutinosa TaxID=7769 RepID=UPI00358E3C79
MDTCHGFQDFVIKKEDIKIERQLGNGMPFPVHLALYDGRRVVLKRIHPELKSDKNEALKEEDRAMFRLQHPNVLAAFGVMMAPASQNSYSLDDVEYSLVMEFAEYGGLKNMLTKCTVPWPLKVRIILDIISGMNFLCEKNVYHKELSLQNVLLDRNFNAKVSPPCRFCCHCLYKTSVGRKDYVDCIVQARVLL